MAVCPESMQLAGRGLAALEREERSDDVLAASVDAEVPPRLAANSTLCARPARTGRARSPGRCGGGRATPGAGRRARALAASSGETNGASMPGGVPVDQHDRHAAAAQPLVALLGGGRCRRAGRTRRRCRRRRGRGASRRTRPRWCRRATGCTAAACTRARRACDSMACANAGNTGLDSSGTTRPTSPADRVRSARALVAEHVEGGEHRLAGLGRTPGLPLSTRDTVAVETPACSARSVSRVRTAAA